MLKKIQFDFKNFLITDFEYERPVILKGNKLLFYSFSGTKINRSLYFLIKLADISINYYEQSSSFEIEIDLADFDLLKYKIKEKYKEINKHIEEAILASKSVLGFSKWGLYLPIKYQCEIVKDRYFDFESAITFINSIKIVKMEI